MTTQFLHGTETIELNDGVRPVKTAASAPIFLIGTADNADPATFPLNTPVLLAASPRLAQKLGTVGTLLGAISQIYAEAGAAVIVVRVASALDRPTQLANIIGSPDNNTGVYAALNAQTLTGVKPKTFIAPGFTSDRPNGVIGVALSGCSGTGAGATISFSPAGATGNVVVTNGVFSVQITNPGDYAAGTPVTATLTNCGGGAAAAVTTGASPNPVVAAMLTVAQKLRGRVYADAPSTSDADALAYRNDWSDARVVVFYPAVEIWDNVSAAYIPAPASASMAGLTARVHNENGFWFSPSNFAFNGVGGVAVPINYTDDPNDQADILNSNQLVLTMSAPNNGYPGWRRWGNATCSNDPEWTFEAVRTCADMIYEAVQAVQAWAVDKPPSVQLLREMAQSMQAYFDYLAKLGAIVGGKVWLDPERNTPQQTSQGIWAWDFDPEPVAPMEHIQNYAHRNQDYYTALVTAVASALNGG